VTVLMSDLRGYTQFAERGDPAHVMDVLNGYLARMTDVVIEHGGTVNEFIGDAVFAVFGAPLAHPDHAERAAACALAMQDAMSEINRAHAGAGLPRFEMGIGVNTGEAVVGNIGSEQRAKYAVVGSAVNVAARVEGATVGGQVFITAATHARIQDAAEVAAPIALEAKGLSEPLSLYELRAMRGRYARTAAPADTEPERPVSVPLTCWVIDGKIVRRDGITGEVRALRARELVVRLATPLRPLTNVKLRIADPRTSQASGDIYGKVTREETGVDGPLTRIHVTSAAGCDAELLEALAMGHEAARRER
jgi:class 3 adenylate cyclase